MIYENSGKIHKIEGIDLSLYIIIPNQQWPTRRNCYYS